MTYGMESDVKSNSFLPLMQVKNIDHKTSGFPHKMGRSAMILHDAPKQKENMDL